MSYIGESKYHAPFLCRNSHFATIYSAAVQKTFVPVYQREQWELPDGDFLLVDQARQSSKEAILLCHGLEGHSKSNYINRSAQYFLQRGYSVFAWNNRSCGGKMNRLPKLYHHASIDDLDSVVQRVLQQGFSHLYLIGFSLGGAQILNYFGRRRIDERVKAGVAVSTPLKLATSAHKIEKGFNRIYKHRFLKRIKAKLFRKVDQFPNLFSAAEVRKIHTFRDLARSFIIPIHGFKDLSDYYKQASPYFSIHKIKSPVLLLNAQNDPILGKDACPTDLARHHPFLFLETPQQGGHCGFTLSRKQHSFVELRALQFFRHPGVSPMGSAPGD